MKVITKLNSQAMKLCPFGWQWLSLAINYSLQWSEVSISEEKCVLDSMKYGDILLSIETFTVVIITVLLLSKSFTYYRWDVPKWTS